MTHYPLCFYCVQSIFYICPATQLAHSYTVHDAALIPAVNTASMRPTPPAKRHIFYWIGCNGNLKSRVVCNITGDRLYILRWVRSVCVWYLLFWRGAITVSSWCNELSFSSPILPLSLWALSFEVPLLTWWAGYNRNLSPDPRQMLF